MPRPEMVSATTDPEELRVYTSRKLAVAGQLRALLGVLEKRGSETRQQEGEELMVKLAEDRFTLAVLGQFKRGKSSLMNALIGRELLPTGVVPLTSAVTMLTFGPTERLVIESEHSSYPQIAPINALADFVTERGNPGNRRRVRTARVEMPLPFLRRGLEFVDTPGIGSAVEANTATTYEFLPRCDAALFVTSVDTPLTQIELEFLRSVRRFVRKIFFVVNKTDLLAGNDERVEVLEFIAGTLREEMGGEAIRLLPVSSRAGLAAARGAEPGAYARSGLAEMQETLAEFLAGEKSSVFLKAVIDKALRLIEAETGELALHHHARSLDEPTRRQRLETLDQRFAEHRRERKRLLEELSAQTTERARHAMQAKLAGFLDERATRISRWIERVSACAGWRLGTQISNRAERGPFRRECRRAWHWLCEQAALLDLTSDTAVRQQWERIRLNVNAIPTLAARVFELPAVPVAAANVTAPQLEVDWSLPSLSESTGAPPVAGAMGGLPVVFTRSWLRQTLGARAAALIARLRQETLDFVEGRVGHAIGKLTDAANGQAAETEARLWAAITGQRGPRPAWQRAMAPLAGLGWGGEALDVIHHELTALGEAIQPPASSVPETIRGLPLPAFAEAAQPDEIPASPPAEIRLPKLLRTRGCPACDHLAEVAWNFFAKWQYALATDAKTQAAFAAESGFCPQHTWQLLGVCSSTGASVGFAPLVQRMSQLLARAAASPEGDESWRRDIARHPGDCRVCKLLRQAEVEVVQRLAVLLKEPGGREAYLRTQGVCLRHLGSLTSQQALGAEDVRSLLENAAGRFETLAEDMQAFALKHDALRRPLTNADETDAYVRAVVHLAGGKDASLM